jgi:hypothetical protein
VVPARNLSAWIVRYRSQTFTELAPDNQQLACRRARAGGGHIRLGETGRTAAGEQNQPTVSHASGQPSSRSVSGQTRSFGDVCSMSG